MNSIVGLDGNRGFEKILRCEDCLGIVLENSVPEEFKNIEVGIMGQRTHIRIPKEQLAQFCEAYHVRRLSLYGSVLRDDFKPDSDIDILIEFEHGFKVGLLKMARMENELSYIFGRKVDLRTPFDLSRYFRQEVLESAEVEYAKG